MRSDQRSRADLLWAPRCWNDYSGIDGFPGRQEPTDHLLVTEYSLVDTVRSMAGLLDTYVALYPGLYDVDLRRDVPELDVPVYLVQGEHEARGRTEPAEEWFDGLDAPIKEWIVFDRSGHRPWVQEPERFAEVMTGTVLAAAEPEVAVDGAPAAPADDADELRNLFADHTPDVWPVHLLAVVLALVAIVLVVRRPGIVADRVVTVLLASLWVWLALVFFGRQAAQLDPLLSAAYGALFLVQAGLFVRAGIVRRELRFRAADGLVGRIGWAALAYALVVYPVLGIILGHGFPEAPLFGIAPCPTVIATFGLLLLAAPPLPKRLLIIPTIWAVLAPLAAVGHGYPEDIGLVVVAVVAWLGMVVHRPPAPVRAGGPAGAAVPPPPPAAQRAGRHESGRPR